MQHLLRLGFGYPKPNWDQRQIISDPWNAQYLRQASRWHHCCSNHESNLCIYAPSQVVMNCFKEPQHAVNAIQTLLDSDVPMAALLVDLSKAFERVNPWILHILQMRVRRRGYATMPNIFYLEGSYATKYRADYYHPELYMLELIWADLFRSSSSA